MGVHAGGVVALLVCLAASVEAGYPVVPTKQGAVRGFQINGVSLFRGRTAVVQAIVPDSASRHSLRGAACWRASISPSRSTESLEHNARRNQLWSHMPAGVV